MKTAHPCDWTARPCESADFLPCEFSPAAIDPGWQPLTQAWHAGARDPGFQNGSARIRWHETALRYEGVFIGAGARNSARTLNERTWELGDVAEVFVDSADGSAYLEVHLTPENHRLQLLWPPDGLARVRAKTAPLKNFMVWEPDWVQGHAHVAAAWWGFSVTIPAARLGIDRFRPQQALRTAVCRYHAQTAGPMLSSFFHQREKWNRVVLAAAD
jgi:hypothetical protein